MRALPDRSSRKLAASDGQADALSYQARSGRHRTRAYTGNGDHLGHHRHAPRLRFRSLAPDSWGGHAVAGDAALPGPWAVLLSRPGTVLLSRHAQARFRPGPKAFHHRRLGSSCVFHIRRDVSPAAGRPADAKNTTQRRAFPDFLLATPLQVLDGEHQQRVACPGRVPDHLAPVVHRHLLPLQGAAQQLAFQVVRRRIQRDLPAFPEFRVGLQPWRAARVQRAPGAPLCGSHVPIFARFSPLFRAKPYKNRTETVHFRTNSVHPQRSRKRVDSHIPRGIFALRAVTGDRNKTHANQIRATPRRRCGCSQRPIQDSTARTTVRLLTDVTKLAARPQITPISSIFGPKFARNPAEFRQKNPKIRREYRLTEYMPGKQPMKYAWIRVNRSKFRRAATRRARTTVCLLTPVIRRALPVWTHVIRIGGLRRRTTGRLVTHVIRIGVCAAGRLVVY